MAQFSNLTLTSKGLALQAKAQAGTQLTFTRIGFGDGQLANGESILDLTNLKNQKVTSNIASNEVIGDGTTRVRAVLTNTGLSAGFYLREVGLFATDPDEGEILYAYSNAGQYPDFLPAGTGNTIVETIISLITIIGNASNVTATIPSGTFVTVQDFNERNADVDSQLAENVQQISEHETQISNLEIDKASKDEVNALATEKANQVDLVTEKSERKAEVAVERARIDSFTSLAEGSTTGDAELIDGRTSTNGVTFPNIGGAVRSKIDNIKSLFAQTVAKKSVDGITRVLNDSTTALTNTIIMYAEHDIKVSINSGYRYIIFLWHDNSAYNTSNFISSSGWETDEQTILKGSYYAIQFGKADSSAINLSDIANLNMLDIVPYEKVAEIENSLVKETLYHILGTGQSLSVGSEGNPSLTKLCPMDNIGKAFMFNGGARPWDSSYVELAEEIDVDNSSMAYFAPLHEKDKTMKLDNGDGTFRYPVVGETISSALAYTFTKITGNKCLVSQHGFGGKSYAQLKKGTIAYNNALRGVAQAKYIAESMGMNYEVMGVTVVHGEADSTNGTTEAQYMANLTEWQSDFNTDIKAITGQTRDVKLYVSQTASASSYNLSTSPIPNAVFKASVQNANIRLVCPQYWFTYKSVHMDNYGYRKLGEYFGDQIGRDLKGLSKSCVYPTKSILSGSTITITVNAAGNLATDLISVPQRSDDNYGFTINDSNGSVITGVSVSGKDIIITLDKAPASDSQIEYAYRPLSDEMGKIGSTGVRGNIKAGDFLSYFDGSSRPYWLSIFSIPVNYN